MTETLPCYAPIATGDIMADEERQQIALDAIRDFAARVDIRAGELIQAGRARNAHYHALKAELAAVEAETVPDAAVVVLNG